MKLGRSGKKRGDDEDNYPTRKLVIVGDGACGKSSLQSAFALTRGDCFPRYVPADTYENSMELYMEIIYRTIYEIRPNKIISLSLWDYWAGQETYEKLSFYTNTDVVLICYSMDSRDSFTNIKDCWYPEISCYCPHAKLMLIGCKSDLAPTEKESAISEQEVQQFAESINAESFTCSAESLTRDNVQDVFHKAATIAYDAGKKKRNGMLFRSCFGGNASKK